MKKHKNFIVKTRRQLADEFGMHVKKGLVCPKEQRKIYDLLGQPQHGQFKKNTI